MGRELFDHAFKEYSRRWAFKHPSPADFFRTMEDASGVDLDWFWRGWFYSTDHVDIALDDVKWYQIDTQDPEVEAAFDRAAAASEPADIALIRDEEFIPTSYKVALEEKLEMCPPSPSSLSFARITIAIAFQRINERIRRSINRSPGITRSSSGSMVFLKGVVIDVGRLTPC